MQQSPVEMSSEKLTGRQFCHCGNITEQTYTNLEGTGWFSRAASLCTHKAEWSTGESDAVRRHGGMAEVAAGVRWYKEKECTLK